MVVEVVPLAVDEAEVLRKTDVRTKTVSQTQMCDGGVNYLQPGNLSLEIGQDQTAIFQKWRIRLLSFSQLLHLGKPTSTS